MLRTFDGNRLDIGFGFWITLLFIVCVFLLGGSSRADVQSLAILRPVSIIFFGIGLWRLSKENLRDHAGFFILFAMTVLLIILQLTSLPHVVWQALPGREILAGIDDSARQADLWRPITMSPLTTTNAFWAVFTPLTLAVLIAQLNHRERAMLLPTLLCLGLLGGVIGFMQSLGGAEGNLYFYQTTNYGAAVGLFANRNHQAVMLACIFPMLAAYVSIGNVTPEQNRTRLLLALVTGGALIPLLLVTGSRAGLILGLLGLLAVPLVYRRHGSVAKAAGKIIFSRRTQYFAAGVSILLLGSLTILMSRAEAIQRLSTGDQIEDLRFKIWQPIVSAATEYFPIGTGSGSIVQAYQLHEPDSLLISNYVNQVHNDWLDLFLTSGIFGFLLLAGWMFWFGSHAARIWITNVTKGRADIVARLGTVIVIMWSLASLGDYPLRTPIGICVFVVALFWTSAKGNGSTEKTGAV